MICASTSSPLCLAVCFVALISISTASTATSSSSTSTDTTKDNIDRNSNNAVASASAPAPTHQNDDNELSYGNMLSSLTHHGGIVAAGVLALSAIAAMVMPMFGLRFCSLIGTCEGTYPSTSYASSGYGNDAAYAAGYGQAMYSPSSYQKRSIEYIGPILKALSSAYDKYGKASAVASTKKST